MSATDLLPWQDLHIAGNDARFALHALLMTVMRDWNYRDDKPKSKPTPSTQATLSSIKTIAKAWRLLDEDQPSLSFLFEDHTRAQAKAALAAGPLTKDPPPHRAYACVSSASGDVPFGTHAPPIFCAATHPRQRSGAVRHLRRAHRVDMFDLIGVAAALVVVMVVAVVVLSRFAQQRRTECGGPPPRGGRKRRLAVRYASSVFGDEI
ncbi:hypothetical protein DL768_004601 [Monosporascus sp. mg162]|nr:hypothetical protein DL768_004601 [Monosporascus sp. mg162]